MRAFFRQLLLDIVWEGTLRKVKAENPYVIAITGSVGKTSTKEAIASVLEQGNRRVVKTAGNMGSDIGVPLTLLGFEEPPAGVLGWIKALIRGLFPPIVKNEKERPYYVLEYSSDKPGDILFLGGKIQCDVAVLTAIVPVHMQAYEDFSVLVSEKLSLLACLKNGGYAVINADDPAQKPALDKGVSVVQYGLQKGKESGLWGEKVERENGLLQVTLRFEATRKMDTIGGQQPHTLQLKTRLIGAHQLYPVLAAAAVGLQEKIPASGLKKALSTYEVPAGRGRVIEGRQGTLLIDDTYNSSPDAVKAGLRMLREVSMGKRRVVALLGNMNELGEQAAALHAEVAEVAAECVDFLGVVGQYAESMAEIAKQKGMREGTVLAFSKPEDLIHQLDQVVNKDDLVYLKASQNGMRFERIVKKLMTHPEQAERLLVRQERIWQSR